MGSCYIGDVHESEGAGSKAEMFFGGSEESKYLRMLACLNDMPDVKLWNV